MRDDVVIAEPGDSLDDLLQQQVQAVDRRIEADQTRPVELRMAVRLTEGKARDAVRRDRKARPPDRKFLVVRIEAEALRLPVRIGERDQAFAAEIELQAYLLERPVGRSLRARGKMHDAVTMRPVLVMGDRLTIERPAVNGKACPVAPVMELCGTYLEAVETLGNRKRHGRFLSLRFGRSRKGGDGSGKRRWEAGRYRRECASGRHASGVRRTALLPITGGRRRGLRSEAGKRVAALPQRGRLDGTSHIFLPGFACRAGTPLRFPQAARHSRSACPCVKPHNRASRLFHGSVI
jgi:hypothetical protein